MAAVLTLTTGDIKNYLVITAATWDTQIAAVLATWDYTIEDMIQPAYLADAALVNILTAGKKLILCGHVKNLLPAAAAGNTGIKTSVKFADVTETIDPGGGNKAVGGSGDGLIAEGWRILKPYLTQEAIDGAYLTIESSTEDYAREFELERKDSEGTVVVDGNFGGQW